MIVATAGHVDHGKSSLLRALTGVDTDRLPEEKARGLSIDLGYAYWDRGDGEIIGFVDVPGHERFIANMLAGVGTLDGALLVVAADEGVMPQTREHVAILDLLAAPGGLVALTKVDRTGPEPLGRVQGQIRELLADSCLAGAPIVPCSAVTGEGMTALAAALRGLARTPRSAGRRFRLAIDRVFTLPGVGLTVTGAVASGQAGIGDKVEVSPGGPLARIRSIHAQGRPAQAATAGRRCALSLAGPAVDAAHIWRGQWLVAGAVASDRIDVELRPSRQASRALQHSFHARLHLGAANLPVRVVRLGEAAAGLAQLLPAQPLDAVWGDRFVLRDPAAGVTLAGGRVITPFGHKRGRAKPARLAALQALGRQDPIAAFASLLAQPPMVVDAAAFGAARNLTDEALQEVLAAVDVVEAGALHVHPRQWRAWQAAAVDILAAAHCARPDRLGLSARQLRDAMAPVPPPEIMPALIASLSAEGRVAMRSGSVHLPDRRPGLPAADTPLWGRVEAALAAQAPHVAALHELARELGTEVEDLRRLLQRAGAVGLAVQVSKNRYALPTTVRLWAERAEDLAGRQGGFTVALFKAEAAIGRNLAVEVLEFFDQAGFTRRHGAERRLLASAEACFGALA